jgi:hypothetical protein
MEKLKIWQKYLIEKKRARLDLIVDLTKKIKLCESKGLYKTASNQIK